MKLDTRMKFIWFSHSIWVYLVGIGLYFILLFLCIMVTHRSESRRLRIQNQEDLKNNLTHMESQVESLFTMARRLCTDERIARLTENPDSLDMIFEVNSTMYGTSYLEMDSMDLTAYMLWPLKDLKSAVNYVLLIFTLGYGLLVMAVLLITERWRHIKTINKNAIRDPLTGVYTRLYMNEIVPPLLASHDRGKINHIGIILFDQDHFKQINDQYGHSGGDYVLSKVASIMMSERRTTDIPIRYGGEEFLILVPSEKTDDVARLAERIRKRISSLELKYKKRKIRVTISGGISQRNIEESIEAFIERADGYLYRAKKKGRNQICSDKP